MYKGQPEDPVTGSLNAGLAVWLIGAGGLPDRYVAAQGAALGRRGRVHIRRDADYLRLRGALAVNDALPLDGAFGLHPKLPFAHDLFAQKQLLPLVAVAPPYHQRSHFDAQDCLENGTAAPGLSLIHI